MSSSAADPSSTTQVVETTTPMMEEDIIPEFCFLKVSIAGAIPTAKEDIIVIQLYRRKECPKTCRNFVALCSSTEITSRTSPCPSYRGCDFHRIIDGFMVQSGDFERFDGTGGYMSPLLQLRNNNNNNGGNNGKMFDDENVTGTHHDQAGIVSMANSGKNTNKSQFFITLKATPHLNGKHVAFGKVVSGMQSVMKMLSVERDGRDRPVPMQRVVICDCGVGRGEEEKHKNDESATEGEEERRNRKKKNKKRKKRSRESRRPRSSDEESSSSDSSSSYRGDRRSKKQKRRYRDSSSDDESSHDKKRKKKHRRKGHRHKKKSSRQSRQSPR
jgi:cyclophilin family peptidyl-prolyl cis-trans isomerase